MNSIVLDGGDYGGIVIAILLIMFGPPLVLALIGMILWMTNKRKAGKIFFILAGIYLVVGLGVCGVMMAGG